MIDQTPLVLSSTRASLTQLQVLEFNDPTRFTNPFKRGMWIDEIGIIFDSATTPSDLRLSLKFSHLPLTSGFIPTMALSKRNSFIDSQEGVLWRLKHPLFVPAGEWVVPTVQHAAVEGTATMTNVAVHFRGRTCAPDEMPPLPGDRWYPWVTSWLGPRQATSNARATGNSAAADLRNPYDQPLYVERLVGAMMRAGTPNGQNWAYSANTFLRIFDSEEKPLVKDETPMSMLMPPQTASWELNAWMKPRGYYRIFLREDFTAAQDIGDTGATQPMFNLIGYRRL